MIGSTKTVGVTVGTGDGPLVVGLGGTLRANSSTERALRHGLGAVERPDGLTKLYCGQDLDLADLVFTDVRGRVARNLVVLTQRFGTREYGALRVNHDLTQDEIAQLVGSSRETVNKVLAEFANRGWICLQGKSLLISDYESLARRARYPTPPGPCNTHRPAGTNQAPTPRPATTPTPYSSAKKPSCFRPSTAP